MQTDRTSMKQLARRWTLRMVRALLAASLLFLGIAALALFVILRRQGDIPPLGEQLAATGAIAVGVLVLLGLWWIPRRQARAVAGELSPLERAELTDRFRRTLGGMVVGAGVLLALASGLRTARELELGVLSERFTQATAQLTNPELVTRVTGVHVLEELARESDALRRPVYEMLVIFVRERGRSNSASTALPLAPDVSAAAAVVARRTADGGASPLRPDFSGANLRGLVAPDAQLDFSRLGGVHLQGADLRGAHMAGKFGVDLRGARLDSANLAGAHLDGARLTDGATLLRTDLRHADLDGAALHGADLRYARLDSAELQGTGLRGARLDGASLRDALMFGASLVGASLLGTDFAGAQLREANLRGTDLSAVRNLTQAQLAGTRMDSATVLPLGLSRPPADSGRR